MGPLVNQCLLEALGCAVHTLDDAAPHGCGRAHEPLIRRDLHGKPRLKLRPEAAKIGAVGENEHSETEVEQVDVAQHGLELAPLRRGPHALGHTCKVIPHPFDELATRVCAQEGTHCRKLHTVWVGRLRCVPPVAARAEGGRVPALDCFIERNGLARHPVRMLTLQLLQRYHIVHLGIAHLIGVQKVEVACGTVSRGALYLTRFLQCALRLS
mmetsp:Transcript_83171/g.166088  ORF Transcript_83171/g.166088 Transcript_83171/m.166088 type:complete len:212 (+) Transcript_83171:748-1383(+)